MVRDALCVGWASDMCGYEFGTCQAHSSRFFNWRQNLSCPFSCIKITLYRTSLLVFQDTFWNLFLCDCHLTTPDWYPVAPFLWMPPNSSHPLRHEVHIFTQSGAPAGPRKREELMVASKKSQVLRSTFRRKCGNCCSCLCGLPPPTYLPISCGSVLPAKREIFFFPLSPSSRSLWLSIKLNWFLSSSNILQVSLDKATSCCPWWIHECVHEK